MNTQPYSQTGQMTKLCFWVLICTVHLTVCFYHVTYAFQSESTLYIRLNLKKPLALNRCNIWSLCDCNKTQTHNHLICKWTLNHLAILAKWLNCVVSIYMYSTFDCIRLWVRVPLQSLKLQISHLFRARSSLTFRQI